MHVVSPSKRKTARLAALRRYGILDTAPGEGINRITRLAGRLFDVPTGAVLLDALQPGLPVVYANPAFERITGYTPFEIRGRSVDVFEGPDTEPEALQQIREALAARQTCSVTITQYRPSGEPFLGKLTLTPVRDTERTLTHYVALLHDVTGSHRAATARRRYTARLEALRQLDEAVLAARRPAEVAGVALRHLLKMLPCRQTAVVRFDAEAGLAVPLAGWADGALVDEAPYPLDTFRVPLECLQHDPYIVARTSPAAGTIAAPEDAPDATLDTAPSAVPDGDDDSARVYCYLDVPLRVRDDLIGVLSLMSDDTRMFTEEEVDIAREVALPLAIAIQNAHLFEQVEEGRRQLRVLSQQLVDVQENERQALARELHDEVGQALTALKLVLDSFDRLQEQTPRQRLHEARSLVQHLLGRVRELSLDLRPGMLDDLGLVPALLWLFNRFTRQAQIEIDFKHADLPERLPSPVETTAYRIIQEALTNVARHAGVAGATVRLTAAAETLYVDVIDTGAGFDLHRIRTAAASSGLINMKERADLLDGTLRIDTRPGDGTRVSAVLPLRSPEVP